MILFEALLQSLKLFINKILNLLHSWIIKILNLFFNLILNIGLYKNLQFVLLCVIRRLFLSLVSLLILRAFLPSCLPFIELSARARYRNAWKTVILFFLFRHRVIGAFYLFILLKDYIFFANTWPVLRSWKLTFFLFNDSLWNPFLNILNTIRLFEGLWCCLA